MTSWQPKPGVSPGFISGLPTQRFCEAMQDSRGSAISPRERKEMEPEKLRYEVRAWQPVLGRRGRRGGARSGEPGRLRMSSVTDGRPWMSTPDSSSADGIRGPQMTALTRRVGGGKRSRPASDCPASQLDRTGTGAEMPTHTGDRPP